MQVYCDIVMPTNHIGEREDITTFQNYLVHMSQIIAPLFESKTDFEVAQLLSQAIDAILGTTTNTQSSKDCRWLNG